MTRKIPHRLVAAALAAGAAGVAAPAAVPAGADEQARSAATKTVVLKGSRFLPKTVEIRRGSYVRWRWADGRTRHDVVSRHFRDSAVKATGTHTVRFRRRGRYPYICTLHQPSMDGVVVVR